MWMLAVLIGFTVRTDLLGVTSFVRSLGLCGTCYDRMLDFLHSSALDVAQLTRTWTKLVLSTHPGLLRCNGRVVLVGDGIKVGKSGRKMPGVKKLHQQSEANTKPTYIMGHSCQAVCVLATGLLSVVAIPLAARIHEGVVFSNRDKRTLLDKMIALLGETGIDASFYFVADAYYASRKVILPLLNAGNHLLTRVRTNAVAYLAAPVPKVRKRGRPRNLRVPSSCLLGAGRPNVHAASLVPSARLRSSLSRMNFVRYGAEKSSARNSGKLLRIATATTISEGQIPGRTVRSQEPNEPHTRSGTVVASTCMIPWAIRPNCMNR